MKTPWRLRLRRMQRWAFLVPVAILIPILLATLAGPSGGDRFLGVVEAEAETIGATGTVRIRSIEVQPGQRVVPGDALVRLDPAGPALDLAVQEARLLDYEQSTVRYRQTLQESARRSRQILQEAAVALEAERMNRIRDVAELAALRQESARLQPLVDKRLVSEMELSALRPKIAALESVVGRYAPLIASLEQRHAQAQTDLEDVQLLLAEAEPSERIPVVDALHAATRSLRDGHSDEPSVLRATRTGVVSRLQHQAGDVVVGGDAIIRITAEHSRHITGLLTQDQVQQVAVGDPVTVYRKGNASREPLSAVVETVEPEVMDLLDPFNPAPRFPVRGRRVRLRILDESSPLVPGETVTLRLVRPRGWWLPRGWPLGSS